MVPTPLLITNMIELSLIELKNIHRNFLVGEQTVHALDDINLSIQAGEYISIMGPSGSGKSTLLNLIGLLDSATEGTYLLNQQDVTALPLILAGTEPEQNLNSVSRWLIKQLWIWT